MKKITLHIALALSLCACRSPQNAGSKTENTPKNQGPQSDSLPVVIGQGLTRFELGPELFRDNFSTIDNWVVQIQDRDGPTEPHVEVKGNTLDCFLPGRGCTVWLKRKLQTRITISYNVICPTPMPPIEGVHPRDINNFWMASDPRAAEQGLFNSTNYTGAFGSYDKMNGYYASTGGGSNVKANLTTRLRRYPREINANPTIHIALNDKDGKPGYLITPDRVMTIQLVAYDDLVQYIVDGKLIYEIGKGDQIQLEDRDSNGKRVQIKGRYDLDRFPVYEEGYFGFRMVGTHHIYSNFRIYSLKPNGERDG